MLPRALQPAMAKLRAMFEAGDRLTAHDVEARLFIDVRNAREYLMILHRDERSIRICDYRRDTPHGRATPIYESGSDPDAPRPNRPDPEKRRHAMRKARERDRLARDGVRLDPLMAAVNRDASMNV